jgi:hypothetical protein
MRIVADEEETLEGWAIERVRTIGVIHRHFLASQVMR